MHRMIWVIIFYASRILLQLLLLLFIVYLVFKVSVCNCYIWVFKVNRFLIPEPAAPSAAPGVSPGRSLKFINDRWLMVYREWVVITDLKRLAEYFLLWAKFEYKTVLRNEISKQKDYWSTIRTKINCGRGHVLAVLRENYWVIGASASVRHCLYTCVFCRRFRAVPAEPRMAKLPQERVNPPLPFTYVGVDYFGPSQRTTVSIEAVWNPVHLLSE